MKRAIEVAVFLGLLVVVVILAFAGWKLLGTMDEIHETVVVSQDTLRLGRATLAEQRVYYRALSKMVVKDANRLGKAITAVEDLVRGENARLAASHQEAGRLLAELRGTSRAGTDALAAAQAMTLRVNEQVGALSADSRELLAAGTRAVDQVEVRLKDPSLDATVANLAQSSANLERMSRAGAESAEAIRDVLKPTRKPFWRRLLELMIPKPTVRLGN